MKKIFLLPQNYFIEHNGQPLPNNVKQLVIHDNDFFKFFPFGRNYLPFFWQVGKESDFIKTTSFSDFSLFSVVNPPFIVSAEIIKSKVFTNTEVCVVGKPFKINITHKNRLFSFESKFDLQGISITNKNALIAISATANQQDYLLIFHKNSFSFHEFCGSVELEDKTLTAITSAHTLQKHGILEEFDITEKGLELKNKESVYLTGKPANTAPFLNHIAFFDAIRQEDFILAESYLATTLAKALTHQHLKEFFPHFDQILTITHNGENKIALISNQSKLIAYGKLYRLEFVGTKISNITEEEN